jgi:putative membrane protein
MKTLAETFLSSDEQQEVTRAVHAAEKMTSGEIVPMVVSESHSYPMAAVVGGVFFALPAALLSARLFGALLWIGTDNMWLFLAFFLIYYFIAHQSVQRLPKLKRYFFSSDRANAAVQEAAAAAFFMESLHNTKAANGILLYISVFEQRVWVLGDSGINEKIDQQVWQEIVDLVTKGIKDGRRCEVICEAITRIGQILQDFFPIEKDDKDELHNLIIR